MERILVIILIIIVAVGGVIGAVSYLRQIDNSIATYYLSDDASFSMMVERIYEKESVLVVVKKSFLQGWLAIRHISTMSRNFV